MIVDGSAQSYKVYEDDDVTAFLDIRPAVGGHTLVIPKKHYENIFDMPEKLLGKVAAAARRLSIRYKERGFDGTNILLSNGEAAQQEVMHLHIHLLPRRKGDGHDLRVSNFGSDGKELKAVWERLKE
jgi:histidine triad (HIT) family protein